MKKILLTLLTLLTTATLWAQAPQRFSYQAIIRDEINVVVASTTVGVKISLIQGTATGPAVYVETHRKTTNANGLVSLEIGEGTALSGTFAGIDWFNGPYLIKTETDPTGGTNYSISGLAPLNSVPYALYAANGTQGPKGDKGDTGATGTTGAAGLPGVAGATSPQGPIGLTGPGGQLGATGAQGLIGLTGLQGAIGQTGQEGIDGAVGATGPQGLAGATGSQGVIGLNGPGGLLGATGAQGPIGLTGLQGAIGQTGLEGIDGAVGDTGPQGVAGATGSQGAIGLNGPEGLLGATGAQGLIGLTGLQGAIGQTGPAGIDGAVGAPGPQGVAGLLTGGSATGNTPHWDGTQWVVNSSNLFNNGGNVGIGTAVPSEKLAITGNVKASGTVTAGSVTYPNTHGSANQILTTTGTGTLTWATPATSPIGGFTHYLGEAFDGGIIFYLYKGRDGLEHGLIVALTESTNVLEITATSIGANRTEDGAYNTNLLSGGPAAADIALLGAGWYLPSIDELGLLYYNRYSAQKGLRGVGNTGNTPLHTLLGSSTDSSYWSSTEPLGLPFESYGFEFSTGSVNSANKEIGRIVRGVKAF